MIEIEKESEDLYEDFGVYERCVFCGNDTDTWNIKSNQPVCEHCAKIHNEDELEEMINNESDIQK